MTLDEVCDLIVDCPHSTAEDEGEGYPLIRTPNIGKGYFLLEGVHRVSEEVYNIRNRRAIPQDDDLILAREAPAGNVAIIKNGEKYCLGQRTVLIRPNKDLVDPDFLTYYLLAPRQQHNMLKTENGSTASHVNMPIIRGLDISLPKDKNTQKKIGRILSQYDELIAVNRKKVQILEEMVMRTYCEWFVYMRFPGYKTTPKENELPLDWEYDSLSKLGVFKRGENITIDDAAGGDIPVVAGGLTPSCYHNESNTQAPVITVSASGANAGFTRMYFENVWAADCSFLDSKCPHLFYLYCFMKTYKESVDNLQKGSAQPHVYAKDINNLQILIPSKDVAKSFEKAVQPFFNEINTCQQKIKKLQQMRDKLLPQLMNGKLEVKV